MKAVSPVYFPDDPAEVVYAKDQPDYMPLPAYRTADGRVVTRWRFVSWRGRWRAFWRGEVFLSVLTFNKPLQPVLLTTRKPRRAQ